MVRDPLHTYVLIWTLSNSISSPTPRSVRRTREHQSKHFSIKRHSKRRRPTMKEDQIKSSVDTVPFFRLTTASDIDIFSTREMHNAMTPIKPSTRSVSDSWIIFGRDHGASLACFLAQPDRGLKNSDGCDFLWWVQA